MIVAQPATKNAYLVSRQHMRSFKGANQSVLAALRERTGQVWQAERLEFSQILTRYSIGIVVTVYAIIDPAFERSGTAKPSYIAALLIIAWVVGASLLAHLLVWPQRRLIRRTASICADALALSLLIHYGERSAAIFFPVYLWVILGNGYRFGIGYMYASMAANVLCFMGMVLATPYWRQEWQFSAGLLIAIVAIPIYSSSLIRKLRLSMQEARAASTAKTEFLSMISHELRTPLNAILGLAQISKITATTVQDRENAVSTEIAAHRLTRMLDGILKFQAVDNGAGPVMKRAFNFIDMLAEIEAIVSPLAWKKKLDLKFIFATGIPSKLKSDPDIIQTIVINLVTNAIKYTREGYVIVGLAFRSTEKGMKLCVEVQDSGPGIDPDLQTRIFDRFVRQVPPGEEDEGGVGLGLSLCQSLSRLLGGSIGYMSARGEGSTFWVEIPAEPIDRSEDIRCHADKDIKLATFGLEAQVNADVAGQFGVLAEFEAKALLEEGAACPRENLVLIADRSNVSPSDWEKLQRFTDDVAIAVPLIAVDSSNDIYGKISKRAVAAVPSPDAVTSELVRTVAEWQRRHVYRDGETLEEGALSDKIVLVADDNTMNRQVICRMLKLGGCGIVEAETGDDALDRLLTNKIDIAILDVNMPDQDGIEVCKTYRSVAARETAAVVVGLTADISPETRSRCLEAGMFDVLSKPLTFEDLRTLLRRLDDPQRMTVSPPRKGDRQEGPVLDKERIRLLIELFGRENFKTNLLTTFETETRQMIEELRLDISRLRLGKAQTLLHAIKSSAKTIGAVRLASIVSILEENGAPQSTQPSSYEGIADELGTFIIACREVIPGREEMQ